MIEPKDHLCKIKVSFSNAAIMTRLAPPWGQSHSYNLLWGWRWDGKGIGIINRKKSISVSRINYTRLDQLLEATPDTIAVSCPFCMIMIDDTIKGKNLDERAKVKDFIALVPESFQERVKD